MKNKSQIHTLKKVFRYLGRYRIFVMISMVLAAATVGLTLYVPMLTGEAVDHILGPENVDFQKIVIVLYKIAVCTLCIALFRWIMGICNNKMTYQVVQDIRNEAFRKIEILPLKYVDQHQHGEIVSRVIADVDQFADGLLMGFTQFFTALATILGTLGFMLSVNPKITVVVVCITPVSFLVANFIAKRTFTMFKAQSEARGAQTALIDEMIENQKIVQAFGRKEEVVREFDEINGTLRDCSLKATFFSSLTNPCTRFVNSLVYTGVGFTGAIAVINGSLSVGQLTCFLSYANQYTKPFNEITGVITELQNAIACAQRIFELIEEEPQIPEPEHSKDPEERKGNIQIQDVAFSYDPSQTLIEDFSLDVKPGQKIAIVGPTGCGKTTLINLLMRFYEVNAGSICVDGVDIREMTRRSLRAGYGMVLQETWLKTGTIRENIMMGRPDATEEEMLQASKASFADAFIRRLPNGYDTFITEDGGSLSQGQKQLLCIARVMLCNPSMLILDEATSSIDTRTEMKVQEAFGRLMKGRTSFIVAHRLSTIKEADVILVMKDGKIIEQGSHKTLLKKGGFYYHLYQSQF